MDIRHLRHFLAVVETGSFHAAAERLNLTQQAISRSIKALEAELGARLIERRARDRRRVGPTEFGKLLLPHAMAVAKDLENLKAQFDNLLGMRHTLVRFAASPTAMRRLVAPALQAFRLRRPKIRVQAMQMVLPSILTRLGEGAFDFIVADEPDEPVGERFVVEPLLRDHCALVCGPRHPMAQGTREQLRPKALAGALWIGFGPFMPTMTGTRAIFEAAGLDLPPRHLETSSLDLTLAELRANRYLAVLPRELVRAELASGTIVELPVTLEPRAGWNISAISLAERTRSPASEQFLDCLRSVAAQTAGRP